MKDPRDFMIKGNWQTYALLAAFVLMFYLKGRGL